MAAHTPVIGFDLDGTLIDTTGQFESACMAAFKEHQLSLSSQTFHDFNGRGLRSIQWFEALGIDDPAVQTSILHTRDAIMLTALKTDTKWLPGAPEMLQRLRSRQESVLIVTNSQQKFVQAIRQCLPEIDELVTQIVCADTQGIEPKPHASGINYALRHHSCPPEKFLYVGDQLFDCQAAQNAGTLFCAYRQDHTHQEALDGAHFVIDDHSKLYEITLMDARQGHTLLPSSPQKESNDISNVIPIL